MENNILEDKDLGKPLYMRILQGMGECGIKLDRKKVALATVIYPENSSQELALDKIHFGCTDASYRNQILEYLKESMSGFANSIDRLEDKLKSDCVEIVIQKKKLDTFSGISRQLWQAYVFILQCEEAQYAGLLQYILNSIMDKMEHVNGADLAEGHENKEKEAFYFGFLKKRWILFGNYADYFLKIHKLPEAEILLRLSGQKYEGSESEARIYFEDDGNIETVASLSKHWKMSFENHNVIRKLMEISNRQSVFLYAEKCEENGNYGLKVSKLVREKSKRGSYIKFNGFLHWGIICAGKEEIIYSYGNYSLNSSDEEKAYLQEINDMKILQEEKEMLRELLGILQKQKHGTAVVIADDFEDEANRLCGLNRGIKIESNLSSKINYQVNGAKGNRWNEEYILSITGIDGALFMDWNGKCLAIGVIVDGIAKEGNAGRGARYNSITNYVNQINSKRCLGIIVSEDGLINFSREASDKI